MDDLLKEAIADAKAVRETALENAKIALEEAFTPRLQSMLSKKIQSEIEVEEGEHEDDEDVEEARHDDEEVDEKMRLKADDEDPTDDASEGARMEDEDDEDDVEEARHDDEEDVEEGMHDEDEDEDDVDEELDLESVLKELEASIEEDDDVEEGARMEDEDEEEKDESVDENDVSSEIGAADNKLNKKAIDSTDIGKANKAKFESKEQVEEEIDLDEVLKALTEEDEEEAVEEVNEVSKLQAELDEHRDVVKYLRGKLNEVNLLNAKLLFTNKLFRGFGLSNDQKMKVVETFDRATNLREVKLVYSTLVESFKTNQPEKIKESKGSASKPVASTKSEKQEILSEGSELRDRFKKLAGITKFNS